MLKNQKTKLILILIAATFFAYFSSLGNPFIWDDEQFITSNQYIQAFDVPKIFSTSTTAGAGVVSNYYRPLTSLSFAIDKAIWGQNPFGFHLTNLFFHISAGILLFFLLNEIFSFRLRSDKNFSLSDPEYSKGESKGFNGLLNPAFWISLFFLIHPVQTEAVTYINSRGDSMMAFFLLGALLLFQKTLSNVIPAKAGIQSSSHSELVSESRSRIGVRDDKIKQVVLYLASLCLFILSILSKETAIAAFPLFFVLILINMFKNRKNFAQSMQLYAKHIFVAVLSACIVGLYWMLRLTILNFGNTLNYYSSATFYSTHLFVRLLTFARVLWTYLRLLVWPYPLHMERDVALVTSPFAWEVWGILLIVVGILWLAVWEIRKKHTGIILFGFALSSCLLLPVSGIIPINGILYEHWLYLPMTGFWVMGYGIYKFSIFNFQFSNKSQNTKYKIPNTIYVWLMYFAILLAILYIVLTIRQNNIWADPITFYRYTLSFAPDSARLHNNLGMSLSDRGDNKGAIIEYKKALTLGSGYPQIYNNLGNAEMQIGEYADAEINLKKALKLAPEFTVAKQNLLKLYLLSKQFDKARAFSDNDPEVEKIIQQMQSQH